MKVGGRDSHRRSLLFLPFLILLPRCSCKSVTHHCRRLFLFPSLFCCLSSLIFPTTAFYDIPYSLQFPSRSRWAANIAIRGNTIPTWMNKHSCIESRGRKKENKRTNKSASNTEFSFVLRVQGRPCLTRSFFRPSGGPSCTQHHRVKPIQNRYRAILILFFSSY